MYANGMTTGGPLAAPGTGWSGITPTVVGNKDTTTATDRIHGAVDDLMKRLSVATTDIRAVADGHLGSLPESADKSGDPPRRPGKLGAVEDKLDALHRMLRDLEREVARLSAI